MSFLIAVTGFYILYFIAVPKAPQKHYIASTTLANSSFVSTKWYGSYSPYADGLLIVTSYFLSFDTAQYCFVPHSFHHTLPNTFCSHNLAVHGKYYLQTPHYQQYDTS